MSALGELEEHHAEREHVAGTRDGLAAGLLGRHVAWRAENRAHLRGRGVGQPRRGRLRDEARQTEVEELHVTIGTHHDVLGLDVAMDDAGGVRDRKRPRELRAHARDRVGSDGTADERRERMAFHQLHGQEAPAVHVTDLVDGDDIRVVERRSGARLLLETTNRFSVAGERGPKQLQGNLAVKPRVVRLVHLAHPAPADERDDVIGADAARQQARVLFVGYRLGLHAHRRREDEIPGGFVCGEQ